MIKWRFDQGRLDYFCFDEIKKIAKSLYSINQQVKPNGKNTDIVRLSLEQETVLPFAPNTPNYPVWRNYGRVFKCLLLATDYQNLICTTDLCQALVENDEMNCDDYLLHFANHFYYPSPVFSDYHVSSKRIFPVLAIIKTLISKYRETGINCLSVDEILYKIANNNQITGVDTISFGNLIERTDVIQHDKRQIRELVKFISQFSFLSWYENELYLDILDLNELTILEKQLQANIDIQEKDADLEILKLGRINNQFLIMNNHIQLSNDDKIFAEGSRIKVTHLMIERNSGLRKLYFKQTQNAFICRMCGLNTHKSYDWSEHIIEIHHLLPLSSPIRLETENTSLKDLVGICPTCHRAVHKYYALWLKSHKQKDFSCYEEAKQVYNEAKNQVKRIFDQD